MAGEVIGKSPAMLPQNKSVVDMIHETAAGLKQWAKLNICDLKNTYNFKPGALEHILEGEINRRGKAVGFHYEGMPNSEGRVIPGMKTPSNKFGLYEAKVEISGVPKVTNNGKSSFFPKSWDPQEIVDAVNEAFNSKQFVPGTRNTFRGTSSNGMTILMFIDDTTGKIISAFPKY